MKSNIYDMIRDNLKGQKNHWNLNANDILFGAFYEVSECWAQWLPAILGISQIPSLSPPMTSTKRPTNIIILYIDEGVLGNIFAGRNEYKKKLLTPKGRGWRGVEQDYGKE